VDSKAEYSALSSTRSQKKNIKKKKLKQTNGSALFALQVKIREGSPEGIRMTMEERICERDEF